jgi:hypothetical protein
MWIFRGLYFNSRKNLFWRDSAGDCSHWCKSSGVLIEKSCTQRRRICDTVTENHFVFWSSSQRGLSTYIICFIVVQYLFGRVVTRVRICHVRLASCFTRSRRSSVLTKNAIMLTLVNMILTVFTKGRKPSSGGLKFVHGRRNLLTCHPKVWRWLDMIIL